MLLIGSDLLADALASPDEAARLAALAAAEALDVRVVVVVREQIGYINSLYCQRILNLDTAARPARVRRARRCLLTVSTTSRPSAPSRTPTAWSWLRCPTRTLRTAGAGRSVVDGRGPERRCSLRPSGLNLSAFDPLPGPVLIEATRLLHKRLRHLNAFHEQGKGPLRTLARKLAVRAVEAGWD